MTPGQPIARSIWKPSPAGGCTPRAECLKAEFRSHTEQWKSKEWTGWYGFLIPLHMLSQDVGPASSLTLPHSSILMKHPRAALPALCCGRETSPSHGDWGVNKVTEPWLLPTLCGGSRPLPCRSTRDPTPATFSLGHQVNYGWVSQNFSTFFCCCRALIFSWAVVSKCCLVLMLLTLTKKQSLLPDRVLHGRTLGIPMLVQCQDSPSITFFWIASHVLENIWSFLCALLLCPSHQLNVWTQAIRRDSNNAETDLNCSQDLITTRAVYWELRAGTQGPAECPHKLKFGFILNFHFSPYLDSD